MISPLQEQGKYLEAFELSKTYSDNLTNALESLFAGKLFLRAIHEINLSDTACQENLLETLLIPKLLDYQTELLNALTVEEETFVKHKTRLLEIRVLRSKQAQNLIADNDQVDIDECDLLSDTTSLRSSRYTASSRGTG